LKVKAFLSRATACLAVVLLAACGGGGSSNSSGSVRLVNATQAYGSLDLYTSEVEQFSAVAEGVASNYVELDEASYTLKLKSAGSSTAALTTTITVAKDTAYTVAAYNSATTLKIAYLTDNQAAPTSGTAALRVFNGALGAGALDIYVTDPGTDLASVSPTVSGISGSSGLSGFVEITKGSYRVRVTANGDKSDLRLDIPSITFTDQQIATLMLTETKGGVLVNAMLVNQAGTVAAYNNTNARLRVIAGLSGNASVTASTSDASLNTALQSPSVGSYVTTSATLAGLALKVNGTAVDTSAITLGAGTDATLLVYGDPASPQLHLLVDDNLPATTTANTKLRLVNLLNGLNSSATLNADYVAVADNVAYGTASTPASIAASTTMRLEVTSPLRTAPLYLATDVSLAAQKVYTLFLMGDVTTPVAVLRKDR
jgi:hypothetical protein